MNQEAERIIEEGINEYKPNIHKVNGIPILIFWEIENKKIQRKTNFMEIWRLEARPKRDKIFIDEKLIILDPKKTSFRYAKQNPIWFLIEFPIEISIPIITINFLDFRVIRYEQSISLGISKEIQNGIFSDIMNQIVDKIEKDTERVLNKINDGILGLIMEVYNKHDKIICLNCNWIGEYQDLLTVKRFGEHDCILMNEQVCPNCGSVAWEEKNGNS